MQVVEVFITNRNNLKYMFVEKLHGNFDIIQYRVFYNKNHFQVLSADDYDSIYGNDKQYNIMDFIDFIKTDLVCNADNDRRIPRMLDELDKTQTWMKRLNRINPSLYGYRDAILSSIDIYNDIFSQRPKEEEHDYGDDLVKLRSYDDFKN